jgi:hypothetical protein
MDQEIVHDAERAAPPAYCGLNLRNQVAHFLVAHHSAKLNVHQACGRKVE